MIAALQYSKKHGVFYEALSGLLLSVGVMAKPNFAPFLLYFIGAWIIGFIHIPVEQRDYHHLRITLFAICFAALLVLITLAIPYGVSWDTYSAFAHQIIPLLEQKDVRIIDFDQLGESDWVKFEPRNSHWTNGFRIARPILETECLVSTCCLKTHQFGGIFTMSLKLHVGVVPTFRHGYEYMAQLHRSSHQRKMIAEINEPFSPALIVLDAIDVFVDGGPTTGKRVKGNVFMAGTDRVAVDAVGVAILKVLGSNKDIMKRRIFEQEQIARAVELGLGASSPSEIDVVSVDPESQEYCDPVVEMLNKG